MALLLEAGADVNARAPEGYVPPHGLRPNDRTPLDYTLDNRSLEGLPEVRRMREGMRGDAARR